MNVGFIGLGKLGLPCALAVESKGHNVIGYDISDSVQEIVGSKKLPYKEIWAQDYLDNSNIEIKPVSEVVNHSEIIFVPIQTPHDERYEGTTRIPDDRVNFNYDWLKAGIETLSNEIERQGEDKVVIIISTVLPGTIEKEIKPLLGSHTKLCYNPFFIAMGTTMRDFLNPEYVLFGVDDSGAAEKAQSLYSSLHDRPFYKTTIKNAELIKVAYNTFIGMKIVYANTMMEICHKIGADVDAVTGAMSLATDRLISSKYLRAGMGDGGGCHPRDNIAMSWLARELDLSHDFFDDLMMAREHQTEWLADLIEEHSGTSEENTKFDNITEEIYYENPIYILGKSFKPETNITTGSPSLLLKNILEERNHNVTMYDPYSDDFMPPFSRGIYFIGTMHPDFNDFNFPIGSIILDPWRYIEDVDGCDVIGIGR